VAVDFVTIEDAFLLQSSQWGRPTTNRPGTRTLDAVLVRRPSGATDQPDRHRPTATTTHTEPFHVSKAIATLDYVSRGARLRVQVGARPGEADLFGRRESRGSARPTWMTPRCGR